MLKEQYGAVPFEVNVDQQTIGQKTLGQILNNEVRWDVTELHLDVSKMTNGFLSIGYGAKAANPEILRISDVEFRDFVMPATGFGNPNQQPLNWYTESDSCVANISGAAHIVKQADKQWIQVSADGAAPMAKMVGSTLTTFDPGDGSGPRLYLIGGYDGTTYYNTVFTSFDGISWTSIGITLFPARYAHSTVVMGGSLYVIMGNNGSAMNDVWSSPDGITWTLVTNAATPAARYFLGACVLNGITYISGGNNGSTALNDVWSTTDGLTWTNLGTYGALMLGRYGHVMMAYQNSIIVIGGTNNGSNYLNDSWEFLPSSFNTILQQYPTTSWIKLNIFSNFTARAYFNAVPFAQNRKAENIILNGQGTTNPTDLWVSTDLTRWFQQNASLPQGARYQAAVAVLNGLAYAFGGYDGSAYHNDVYRTNKFVV